MKILLTVVALFTTAMLIGFCIGHMTSVDSSNPRTAKTFLALYGEWERVDDAHGRIKLVAGDTYYSYLTGDASVSTGLVSALEVASSSMPHPDLSRDAQKLISLVGAAPATGLAEKVLTRDTLMSFKSLEKGESPCSPL